MIARRFAALSPATLAVAAVTVAIVWCAGCTTTHAPEDKDGSARAQELHGQRLMLSEGYSILYHDAETLGRIKLLIYVKEETDAFERVVMDVAAFGTDLRSDLERIDRDYPGVRVDLDPLPELEKRKRRATAMDKALDNAPLVGHSGAEYERTVLISIANGLNQERHLADEMAKEEPDAGLKKFLLGVKARMDALYEEAEGLLKKKYYRPVPAD